MLFQKEKEDKNQINRLDQKRERRSQGRLFLFSPISRKPLSEKVSPCTFLKKASLTLETALVLPMFFFAVMGGMIYVIIRHRGRVADLNMKQMLLMAAFSLYFGFASGGVDNAAHAGGLLCGFIAAVIVYHPRKIWKTVP